jgi:hypothetical protein
LKHVAVGENIGANKQSLEKLHIDTAKLKHGLKQSLAKLPVIMGGLKIC